MLAAAGHRVRRRREWPAGLTPREVEVLRLLARGLSNREIAERLAIAPKTAGNHVEHIYSEDRRLQPRDGEPVRRRARADARLTGSSASATRRRAREDGENAP